MVCTVVTGWKRILLKFTHATTHGGGMVDLSAVISTPMSKSNLRPCYGHCGLSLTVTLATALQTHTNWCGKQSHTHLLEIG